MFFKNKNLKALLLTNVFTAVIRLITNLIIARLLSPEIFAITGLAATVLFALEMLSDGGFRAFILRSPNGDQPELLNTLWTIRLIRNLLLILVMYSSSGSIAAFFDMPQLAMVLKVLCLSFFLDGIKPLSEFYFERKNQLSKVMYLNFSSYLCSIIVMLIGVWNFPSYWAVVVGMISNNLFICIGSYLFLGAKGCSLYINKKITIEFLSWAKFIVPSSVITLLLLQLDKIILGRTFSAVELGLYYVAFNFSSAAMMLSVEFARGYLEPQLAKLYRAKDSDFVNKYYQSRLKISLLLAFLMGGLSGASVLFFDILYDDRYLSASFYLSVLMATPLFALITYPSEACMIIHGQVKATLTSNIIRVVWFSLSVLIGYILFDTLGILFAIAAIEIAPGIYLLYRLRSKKILMISKELMILFSGLFGYISGALITSFFKDLI